MRRAQLMVLVLLLLAACGRREFVPDGSDVPSRGVAGPLEELDGRYRLRPDWEVARLEDTTRWTPKGVLRVDGGYQRLDGSPVAEADVRALLVALDNLYPSPGPASWKAWTDDFSAWSVVLTGADGEEVGISSSSSGNPRYGPWNITYRGRTYLQYDGALVEPLAALFQQEWSDPDLTGEFDPSPGSIIFEVFGARYPAVEGVYGLNPLGVSMSADLGVGLSGAVDAPHFIGMDGSSASFTDELLSLELRPEGVPPIACTLRDESETSFNLKWSYICPLISGVEGEEFHYPVSIEYVGDDNAVGQLSGAFWGRWGAQAVPHVMLPEELELALAQHDIASELLSNHMLSDISYTATVPDGASTIDDLRGLLRLDGERLIDDRSVRYTITTPFAVQKGQLVTWGLRYTELNAMLHIIAASPLTQRVFDEDPYATIDLYYAEDVVMPLGANMDGMADVGALSAGRTITLEPCGDLPSGVFPSEAHGPRSSFSFNASRPRTHFYGNYGNEFIIIDDRIIVSEIDLDPSAMPADEVPPDRTLTSLIPTGLDTAVGRQLERIWLSSGYGGLRLVIWPPEHTTPDLSTAVEQLVGGLPHTAMEDTGFSLELTGMTLSLDDQGRLVPMACD